MERRPTIKKLTLRRRYLGLTALGRNNIKVYQKAIFILAKVQKVLRDPSLQHQLRDIMLENAPERVENALRVLLTAYVKLSYVDAARLDAPLPKIIRRYRTINSFSDEDIPTYFRFRSKEQLHRLKKAFHIGDTFKSKFGHVFTGDEFLLVSFCWCKIQ